MLINFVFLPKDRYSSAIPTVKDDCSNSDRAHAEPHPTHGFCVGPNREGMATAPGAFP